MSNIYAGLNKDWRSFNRRLFLSVPYLLVFIASFLVDVIPLIGPPAWTVMVFFQIRYELNIWLVIIVGVLGSALGRLTYSAYIPLLSKKVINEKTHNDIEFIGSRLENNGWKVQLFVLLYTMVPLPSTPLFTAAGMARIKTINIIPAFIVGKFISDAVMVVTGNYVAVNAEYIGSGFFTWKTAISILAGLLILSAFLFTDWRYVLQEKKFRIRFNIWK